jgi:hypothetical protein
MDVGKIIDLRRRKDEKTAENLSLKDDLFLTSELIQALAITHTKRLKKYGGNVVTLGDTQKSRTVSEVFIFYGVSCPIFLTKPSKYKIRLPARFVILGSRILFSPFTPSHLHL